VYNIIRKREKEMAREEMVKRMEELEDKRWMLSMKDRWDSKDFAQDNEWFNEWLSLNEQVVKLN
jgi:hypothetical protein